MQQVRLGSTGLWVSPIWLGTMSFGSTARSPWVLDEEASRPILRRALDLGITTFDTADVYSHGLSEEIIGRQVVAQVQRDQVVIASKVCNTMRPGDGNGRGLGRKHLFASIDASLRRLGTDHLDLWQVHRWDPTTPIEETMGALDEIVRSGRVRYIGASSMFAWQFAKARRAVASGGATFVSMQPHYNLLSRDVELELAPMCLDLGVGMVPWSPLARGLLARPADSADGASERRRYDEARSKQLYGATNRGIVDAVGGVAERHAVTRAQVALAWLRRQPAVTAPIVGATRIEQLDDAVASVDVVLSDRDIAELEAPYVRPAVYGVEFTEPTASVHGGTGVVS